jgi:hypothetical protein
MTYVNLDLLTIPKFFLNLSINNKAAISRIRDFTGANPTNSSSNKFKIFAISVFAYSSCKLQVLNS